MNRTSNEADAPHYDLSFVVVLADESLEVFSVLADSEEALDSEFFDSELFDSELFDSELFDSDFSEEDPPRP